MSHTYPKEIETLVELLRTLPGVGRRGAERMAMALARWPDDKLDKLVECMEAVRDRLCACPECGHLSMGGSCSICADLSRDRTCLCVVETSDQIINFERMGIFRGLYHVLGGRLSPLNGRGPESLRVASLLSRVEAGGVAEIVLALSPDVEGQATAFYLADLLKGRGVHLTALATGVPAGADITLANAATLAAAFAGRIRMEQ